MNFQKTEFIDEIVVLPPVVSSSDPISDATSWSSSPSSPLSYLRYLAASSPNLIICVKFAEIQHDFLKLS